MIKRKRKIRRGNFTRLAITYFCVLVPVLLISFAMTESTLAKLNMQEKAAGEQRMERAIANVSQFLVDAKQNSLHFSNVNAFRPNTFFQSPQTEIDGVRMIRTFKNYDSNVTDIVMYYGTDVVYGSSGLSELDTYFEKINCTAASAAKAIAAIQDESDKIELLEQNGNDGLLLFHYANHDTTAYIGGFSINFIVSIQQFTEKLQNLMDPTLAYVNFTIKDEKTVHCSTESGQFTVISDAAFPKNTDAYTTMKGEIELFGVRIEALHSTEKMTADIRQNQTTNYLMIAGGLALSTALAYIFSKIRVEQITWLEMLLRGEMPDASRLNRGEFAGLHNLILNRNKIGELQGRDLEHSRQSVRQQLVHTLTSGGISDEDAVKTLLKSCDIEWTAEYYFIGAILFPPEQEVGKIDRMEKLLTHDFSFRGTVSDHTVLYWLAATQGTDASQKERLTLGKRLQEVLVSEEVPNARIAASAVFMRLADASRAYAQARKTMEHFIRVTTMPGQCLCWEDVVHSEPQKKLTVLDAAKLTERIQAGNSVEAGDEMLRLSALINAEGEDPTHRAILRAQLLSLVGNALPKHFREKFWNEASEIHLESCEEFEHTVRSAMVAYVVPQETNDLYAKLSAYVDANYTSCDLTAEQVAKMAKITPQYLTRLFKNRAGLSYMDYVTQLRMKKACQLLRTTKLSVAEVVRQSGYIDASSFRRKFRNVFNCGVAEYRELANPPQIPPEMLPFGEREQTELADAPSPEAKASDDSTP